jgi:hypothetical protein
MPGRSRSDCLRNGLWLEVSWREHQTLMANVPITTSKCDAFSIRMEAQAQQTEGEIR